MKSITLDWYTNSRVNLSFFMYLPEVSLVNQSYKAMLRPCLFLQKKHIFNPNGENQKQQVRYKITTRNIADLIRVINTAIGWFYDDSLKDLYGYNDENELVFNLKYREINSRTKPEKDSSQYIQLYPSLVKPDTFAKGEEGVLWVMNSKDYAFYMTLTELEDLLSVLKDFSFIGAVNTALSTISIARILNSIDDGTRINNESYSFNEGKNIWVKEKVDKRFT